MHVSGKFLLIDLLSFSYKKARRCWIVIKASALQWVVLRKVALSSVAKALKMLITDL